MLQKGKPFQFGPKSRLNVGRDFHDFAWAYWNAAKLLFEALSETADFDPQRFNGPVMFLYRHAIETELKGILSHLDVDIPESTLHTHDLLKLRSEIIARLNGARKINGNAVDCIGQLNGYDPRSLVGRYPVEWQGQDRPFDLRHFVERCDATLEELDKILNELLWKLEQEIKEEVGGTEN